MSQSSLNCANFLSSTTQSRVEGGVSVLGKGRSRRERWRWNEERGKVEDREKWNIEKER